MLTRRNFLYTGLASSLGITYGDLLKAESEKILTPKAQSIIHIFLPGGMAAHESWDPKPMAPAEYRGPLGSVPTSITGIHFSEHLKNTAKIADKMSVVRSMTHGEAAHERGVTSMFTGYRPSPAIEYPSLGSVVSHELGDRNYLPAYICVPQKITNNGNDAADSGYLSKAYGPFSLGSDPADKNFKVRDLSLAKGISSERFDQRRSILDTIDSQFKYLENSDALRSMESFYDKAYGLISSPAARAAFELEKEPESVRNAYGYSQAGQRFLMSRRLVEAGVRFVSVTYGGWDMHTNIGGGMSKQLPAFDQAYSALITDLDQRGMLDSTIVLVSSEFGRTPKINKDAGRDHWPRVFSIAFAGGGFKRGYVHGSSDATGADVETNPFHVENMAATVYHQLGIDPNKELMAPGGRPVPLVKNGIIVEDLLA